MADTVTGTAAAAVLAAALVVAVISSPGTAASVAPAQAMITIGPRMHRSRLLTSASATTTVLVMGPPSTIPATPAPAPTITPPGSAIPPTPPPPIDPATAVLPDATAPAGSSPALLLLPAPMAATDAIPGDVPTIRAATLVPTLASLDSSGSRP